MARLNFQCSSATLRRPKITGCLTAGVLFGAGDILAQQAVEKKGLKNHDVLRTARLAGYGSLIFSPLLMPWFRVLERVNFKSRVATTAARVAADQLIAAPCFIAIFFTAMPILEGKPEEIQDRLSDKWASTWQRNIAVFVPIQAFNFAVVPAHLRLLTINVAQLFWNTYLSYANSSAGAKEDLEHLVKQ
ncbi:hypothetical protein P389DRAFT_193457 [Cystobasidium minutum MCA 4210]|uniref:uncharacterized protein n=1 Tax=Cystobasidium minutum MCA 4210 TaxID=1397322 RepID=UPI0034CF5B08|eukprot:jgi/Rhomi1/193457/gm1.1671_g